MGEFHVLFVDIPGYQPLPSREILKITSHGARVQAVQSESAALATIDSHERIDLIMSNEPSLTLFSAMRQSFPKAHNILLTDQPMEIYSMSLGGKEEVLLDHVIANHPDTEWTTNEIRITIQKILTKDIFGLEKYLSQDVKIYRSTVKSSSERDQVNTEVMSFAESCRLSSQTAKMIWGISEELLMNAIYDAPAAAGIERYRNIPRMQSIDLAPEDFVTLTYGCDGQTFGLACSDPFGLLAKAKLLEYLKKVIRRADSSSIIDTKEGGAGLGLFKVLYSSHGIVCNVEPKQKTEIMALINVESQLRDFSRMARSIHYFST